MGTTGLLTDIEPTVIDIDFRERYDDLMDFGPFAELQRAFARGLGLTESDCGRILIIDDTRDLESHIAGIEKIVKAPSVRQVICLVIGPAHDDVAQRFGPPLGSANAPPPRRRVALRRPFALRAPHVTLWVGDARGIGWEMSEAQPTTIAVGDAADDGAALDALIEALRTPRIFDQVYETVGALPEGVAAPGLRAMVGRADDEVLADAQVRAVDRLLVRRRADGGDIPPPDLVIEPLTLLLRYPRTPHADMFVVGPTGPVGRDIARCRDLIKEASDSRAVVTSRGAILRPGGVTTGRGLSHAGTIWENVRATGDVLAELRGLLAELFTRYDSRHPLDTTSTMDLERHGFDLTPPADTSGRDVLSGLQHLIRTALERRHPITEIGGWLDRMHAMLTPTGSRARVEDLDRVCSDEDIVLLRRPPALTLQLTSMLATLPVVVCCLLAGLAAGSMFLGIPIALAALAASAAGGWRLTVARQIPQHVQSSRDLLVLCLLAALSAAVGVSLTAWPLLDPYLTTPVQLMALGVAVVGLLWWPQAVWSRAVRQWRPERLVSFADRHIENLNDLMVDVALHDWVLIAVRRKAADLTRAMSTAFEDISTELDAYAERLRGHPPSPRPDRAAGVDDEVARLLREHSPEITKIIADDIVDVVSTVVEDCWADLERDAMDALQHWVTKEVNSTLAVYGRHLDRTGIHATPPFGTVSADRHNLVDAVWRESRRVAGLLRASVTDPGILQLCAPEHLQFIDVAPSTAALVRFAPKAAQHALARRGPELPADPSLNLGPALLGDLVWTDWGQVAGVLRLARMRPGAVETIIEEGS